MSRPIVSTLALALALGASPAMAQLEHGGAPASLAQRFLRPVPTLRLPEVDEEALRREDGTRGKDVPFRFGFAHEVELDLAAEGVVDLLADGTRVTRLRLSSPGARSLSLVFSRFQLPLGGELFAYDDARERVLGAYTLENHNADGGFAIQPVAGDALVLEYVEPAGASPRAEIRIASVVHDYVGVLGMLAPRSDGGANAGVDCEIDVNCPEGNPWRNQIDATVHLLVGASLCTGSLVNNTAHDGTQLLLSAEHCGSLNTTVFVFNYQNSICMGGTASQSQTVQGSVELAASDPLDCRLVRITSPIPASFNPYYAGWDRGGSPPTNTLTIHHPFGNPKKISFDNQAPVVSGTQWQILQWDLGVTEPGSSGCGLFDPKGRIVGQLFGGSATCASPINDFYGRIDAEWSVLAAALDPIGTGEIAIDGFDPDSVPPPPLDATNVVPNPVPVLSPGTAKTTQIHGKGFTTASTVDLDGVPLASSAFAYFTNSVLVVDLGILAIGAHTFTVHEGANADSLGFDVAPPTAPVFQAGTGDPGNVVLTANGVDLFFSGPVGDVQVLYYSTSNVPSVHPLWMLELGNNFTQLYPLVVVMIPSSGWTQVHQSVTGLAFTTIYGQTSSLSLGLPIATSDLQSIFVFL